MQYFKNTVINEIFHLKYFNGTSLLIPHEIKEIYNRLSIPTIEESSIVISIKRLVSKILDLDKYSDDKICLC